MKTAVEWLESEMLEHYSPFDNKLLYKTIHKAKEMEKEQIIDACNKWFTEGCRYSTGFEQTVWEDEEDYYNQTFNQ
jgi:hypothetical protein